MNELLLDYLPLAVFILSEFMKTVSDDLKNADEGGPKP